ncbi:MAG: ribulose-phosphate 3-epimerase [Candidatus Cloacimonetes bacterium]|nr:ribulose-phosphate 3-epimerase [Candidatus Cloacimonadota bacterium]
MQTKIAPSILSANFLDLEKEIKQVERSGADMLHLDIMDGHFVPNLTFGPGLVKQIRKITNLPLDAHLMISNPEFFIPKFIEAGADYLSFHIETDSEYKKLLNRIRKANVKAGIAINPETPLKKVGQLLNFVDFILIMTVHPGFGGQKYIEDCTQKIQKISEMINQNLSLIKTVPSPRLNRGAQESGIEIEVDGGINYQTAKLAKEAGANILVAGNFIFSSNNYKEVIKGLRNV